MTDVSALEGYAGDLSVAAAQAKAAAEIQHQVIHGDKDTDVLTEGGLVPSLAKQAVKAQLKVNAALEDVAAQMAGAMMYATVAQGLAGTVNGAYFSTPSPNESEYNILYLNRNGEAEEQARYPSAVALEDMKSLLRPMDGSNVYDLLDDMGFVWGDISAAGFNLPGLSVSQVAEEGLSLSDKGGFMIMESTPGQTSLGAMTWRDFPYPGLWLVDPLGFITSDLNDVLGGGVQSGGLPSVIPHLAQELCGVDGVPLTLYVDGLLPVRGDVDLTRATLAAELNPVVISSSEAIRFTPSELGTSAKLYTRPLRGKALSHAVLDLRVKSAPNPPAGPAPAPKVLLFADSIGNHQGPMLLQQFLQQWGYAPTFVGTYPSSAVESDGWNKLGPLAEARQSWSGNQFSYEDTTYVPLPVGDEAAYTAGTKATKWGYNPFLRAATVADPAAFVKNGYIFDPAFYQQRFGLDTPTIVINALNTNDFRDQSAADIYRTVYENDILFHTQFRAAWPNAKIIRCMPGAARNQGEAARDRDGLWASHYVPAIRAMLDARAALADPNISIASTWAFASPEAGYQMDAGNVDATTGAITAELSDWLHPQGSTRRQYYQYLSGHVACAAVGLI